MIAALNISNMDTQEDRRKGMILPDYAFQAAYGCDKMKKAVQQQSGGIHMKRRWFLLCGLTAAVLSAAACQPEEDESEEDTFQEFTEQKSAEKSTEEEPYAFYLFSEELAMTVDGRSFLAEDAPENAAEEAVFSEWLAEFLQDPKLYLEGCPESRMEVPEVKNKLGNYEQDRYQIDEFVLHELETVTVEELTEAGENDRVHPDETAEQYALTETLVIRADWTEEREEPVNYGNGSHSRYYVCGRTEEDPVWRIYEWGFM